jgi:hypothetical protein
MEESCDGVKLVRFSVSLQDSTRCSTFAWRPCGGTGSCLAVPATWNVARFRYGHSVGTNPSKCIAFSHANHYNCDHPLVLRLPERGPA